MNPAPNWGVYWAREAVAAGSPGIWVMWLLGGVFTVAWIVSGHPIVAIAALLFFAIAAVWHISEARSAYAAGRMQRRVKERDGEAVAEHDEIPPGG